MNRNNFFIHVGIAVVIVTLAAVLGQIRRWETSLSSTRTKVDTATSATRTEAEKPRRVTGEAELLVHFRPGVSLDEIKRIAARNNDLVDDNYEAVKGWVSIDD